MTDLNTKNQVRVGAFLIAGLVLVLTSIFMIGGDSVSFSGKSEYAADFEHVQGLAVGSVISLSGLPIGNIDSFDLSPDSNSVRVHFSIDKKFSYKMTSGSQVEIRTQGALGDKYIYIYPGRPDADVLTEGSLLPVAKATDLLGVLSERGKETEKLFDIINHLHAMTSTLVKDNQIGQTLNNLSTASTHLKETSVEVKNFSRQLSSIEVESLDQSLKKMNHILTKIDRGQGTLGALINDPSLHDRLKALVGANESKNHVKSLIRSSIQRSETGP